MTFPAILCCSSACILPFYLYNLLVKRRVPQKTKWCTERADGWWFRLSALLYGLGIVATLVGSAIIWCEKSLVSEGNVNATVFSSFVENNWEILALPPTTLSYLYIIYTVEIGIIGSFKFIFRSLRGR